jgi:hypothetical protein
VGLLRQHLALSLPNGISFGDHSQSVLRLLRLLLADGDLVPEVLAGLCSICLHVICADTGCCSYYLTDKWAINGVLSESLCQFNGCFTKLSSSFLEVVRIPSIWHLNLVI